MRGQGFRSFSSALPPVSTRSEPCELWCPRAVDGHVSRDRPILQGVRPNKGKRPCGLARGCMVLAPGEGSQDNPYYPKTAHDELEHAGDALTPGRGVSCGYLSIFTTIDRANSGSTTRPSFSSALDQWLVQGSYTRQRQSLRSAECGFRFRSRLRSRSGVGAVPSASSVFQLLALSRHQAIQVRRPLSRYTRSAG